MSYQRSPVPLSKTVVADMHDPNNYKACLGNERHYHNFLVFFEEEMDKKGWQEVLNEYMFKGDERADDMLIRMFDGILHPIIHLGFGVEFEQPAIVAEALAQAAIHRRGPLYLIKSEKSAKEAYQYQNTNGPSDAAATIVQLLEEIYADTTWPSRDMVKYASQVRVNEDSLEEKTAEMINAASEFPRSAFFFFFFFFKTSA